MMVWFMLLTFSPCPFFVSVLSLLFCFVSPVVLYVFYCPFPDLDKMDSEKEEMNQADIAALHHFYSRHISDLPDDQALTELFAQVTLDNTTPRCFFGL